MVMIETKNCCVNCGRRAAEYGPRDPKWVCSNCAKRQKKQDKKAASPETQVAMLEDFVKYLSKSGDKDPVELRTRLNKIKELQNG